MKGKERLFNVTRENLLLRKGKFANASWSSGNKKAFDGLQSMKIEVHSKSRVKWNIDDDAWKIDQSLMTKLLSPSSLSRFYKFVSGRCRWRNVLYFMHAYISDSIFWLWTSCISCFHPLIVNGNFSKKNLILQFRLVFSSERIYPLYVTIEIVLSQQIFTESSFKPYKQRDEER